MKIPKGCVSAEPDEGAKTKCERYHDGIKKYPSRDKRKFFPWVRLILKISKNIISNILCQPCNLNNYGRSLLLKVLIH